MLKTCSNAQQASDQLMPEADTELTINVVVISPEVTKSLEVKAKDDPVFTKNWMVSVANPHAAAAGAGVLSEGGTAADAMVAVQAVLGLVEPQSSGIGGGAFLVWYDGKSGEQIETSIFIGPAYYQCLKHMVADKQHSRCIGPMVNLTRQPAEGRSRDGGLRFGEMERDCMISHGASRFTKERIYDVSDKYSVHTCNQCGLIVPYNHEEKIHLCKVCDNRVDFSYVEIPYSCKLLFQELISMNVVPRIITNK